MKISVCKNYHPERDKEYNNNKVARGWQIIEVPWDKDSIINITTGKGISCNEFREGIRKKENWVGCSALMLDFDDGRMTVENLLSEQSKWEFDSYVFSSQNHQKSKGSEPPCDRLRVLIPFKEPITDERTRDHIEKVFKQKFKSLDPGFMDKTRYFAHGTTSVSSFTESKGPMDWKLLVNQVDSPSDLIVEDDNRIRRDFLTSGVSKGKRDIACFKAACTLRDCGYTINEAAVLLKKGADKCDPPFSEDEVLAKLKSAYSYDPEPFAFIEATTAAYYYHYQGKLYQATKDILKETFRSLKTSLPENYPILEFKFDVHDDLQIDLGKRTYNLFKPTHYHLMEKNGEFVDPLESFRMISKLLKNLIPVRKERDYFLNWLAAILQTRKKLMTSFVFIGQQGAGKGVFLGHILKPLFGQTQTLQVEDEQLKSSFNGWIKNACFIAFNEVAHDNHGRNSLNSKIKSIITDPTITINEKNIRTYQIENNVNCVFYSNERVPLLVERSDRRFTIIETGDNLAKKSWFQVPESFDAFKKEMKSFAQFLWNLDVDETKANTPLKNNMKDALISAGQNRWEEFVYYLKKADQKWFEENTELLKDWDGCEKQPEYALLSWENIEKRKQITKEEAFRLFTELYKDKRITKSTLSKHLLLYGIRGQRKRAGDDRLQYYEWDKPICGQGKP